jgi:heptosyltransferase-1
VPLVAIFAGSQPDLTGPVGGGPLAILGAQGAPPTLAAVADAVEAIMPRGEDNADEQA